MGKKPSGPITPLSGRTALTVGSLVLLAGGVGAVVKYLSWEEAKIEKAADAVMKSHANLPIGRSHPDASDTFVSKRALNGHLHKMDKRLDHMEHLQRTNQETQKQILERLPRTRHYSHIVHDMERRRLERRAAARRRRTR